MGRIYIVDANIIIASMFEDEEHFDTVSEILEAIGTPYWVPVLALAEAAYRLGSRGSAEVELVLADSIANGEIVPVYFDDHWEGVAHYVRKYIDRELGISDATVVAAAERLALPGDAAINVISMDRNDLEGIQTIGGRYLNVISHVNQL